jgi:hypothetical protein
MQQGETTACSWVEHPGERRVIYVDGLLFIYILVLSILGAITWLVTKYLQLGYALGDWEQSEYS